MFSEGLHAGDETLSAFHMKKKIPREEKSHFCYLYLFEIHK